MKWNRFFTQWQKDLKLWLFYMAWFLLFRISFLVFFNHHIDESSSYFTIVAALLNGMRYDSVVATYFILVPFILSVICGFADIQHVANKIRVITATLFVILSTFVWFVTFSYFKEFNDQFNHFIFGLVYDDLRATLITIWKEYHVIPNIIGMVLITVLMLYTMRLFISRPFLASRSLTQITSTIALRIFVIVLSISLFAVGIRGSMGRRPIQQKDAAITGDEFLNKSVLNPHMALIYAVKQHLRISKSEGLNAFLPDGEVPRAARLVFSTRENHKDLDDYTIQYAKGSNVKSPRHIFIVVGESYSAWPLLREYESLGLAEGVKSLAENGLSFKNFLPSSGGTMASLVAIMVGLPDAGVYTNYQKTSQIPYPSSIAGIFKQLGYKTRFFYGGYLSWQRIGDFCRSQGFDEIYGGSHMGNWASSNEWGVDDEFLFEFVLKTVSDDERSLNIILTTTFHRPFDIDVRAKGFKLKKIPDSFNTAGDSDIDLNALGHFWYADQCIKNFVGQVEDKLKFSLVAITGDHAWRDTPFKQSGLFEKTAVPLILYGKEVLDGISLPEKAAGSHLDIGSTLIELTAPQGFQYHHMGKDLLDPNQRSWGISRDRIIGPNFIADLQGSSKIYPLPGKKLPPHGPKLKQLKQLHDATHGIAWWRIMRGPKL
jgi:phosphoglycerol transferase MdoB-like AlkP superfamily enzyme